MSRLRFAVLGALIVVLSAAPVTQARPDGRPGGHVLPATAANGLSGGELLGVAFAAFYAASPSAPFDPCGTVGRSDKVLLFPPLGETTTCTVKPGTAVAVGLGAACSDVEPEPFFGADADAQRACAESFTAGYVLGARVTVDGGPAVDVRTERFLFTSPQVRVPLPEDNVFGAETDATLVANAYVAIVRGLRPGRHTIAVELVEPGGTNTSTLILDVVPRGRR